MLTATQVEAYRSQGFCVVHGFFTEAESRRMLDAMASICKGATLAQHDSTRLEMEPHQSPDGTKVRRVYDPCTHYDVFRDLACGSRLVDCMVQLLGPVVVFFSSKIYVKPPEIGSLVEWQQDMA